MSTNDNSSNSTTATAPPLFQLGDLVAHVIDGGRGTIRYRGPTPGTAASANKKDDVDALSGDDIFLGIEWEEKKHGRHDGVHNGVRYFQCERPGHGSFVRPSRLMQPQPLIDIMTTRYSHNVPSSDSTVRKQSGPIPFQRCPETGAFVNVLNCDCTANVELSCVNQIAPARFLFSARFPNLQELSLAHTLLHSWDPLFLLLSECVKLDRLNLSANPLGPLTPPPAEFLCCKADNSNSDNKDDSTKGEFKPVNTTLKWLNVSTTGISGACIPHFLQICTALEHLHAGYNDIAELPETVTSSSSAPSCLKALGLEGNCFAQIGDITRGFSPQGLAQLEFLCISRNKCMISLMATGAVSGGDAAPCACASAAVDSEMKKNNNNTTEKIFPNMKQLLLRDIQVPSWDHITSLIENCGPDLRLSLTEKSAYEMMQPGGQQEEEQQQQKKEEEEETEKPRQEQQDPKNPKKNTPASPLFGHADDKFHDTDSKKRRFITGHLPRNVTWLNNSLIHERESAERMMLEVYRDYVDEQLAATTDRPQQQQQLAKKEQEEEEKEGPVPPSSSPPALVKQLLDAHIQERDGEPLFKPQPRRTVVEVDILALPIFYDDEEDYCRDRAENFATRLADPDFRHPVKPPVRIKANMRSTVKHLKRQVATALNIDADEFFHIFYVDEELHAVPGAVSAGMHCRPLVRDHEALHCYRMTTDDCFIVTLGKIVVRSNKFSV